MAADIIRSQSYDSHRSYDPYDVNLQIAKAMSRCDIIEEGSSPSYDHPYSSSPESPPTMTSYSSMSPEHYPVSYPSPHSYDVTVSEYDPTKIKDEQTYHHCALYNDVRMTSHLDESIPSTLDNIKSELNGSDLPPLSPEDTSSYFFNLNVSPHTLEPCENESDVPDEVRSLLQSYLPPIRYALPQYYYERDQSHRRHYSDQDSGYCESSDSSSDTPPSTPGRPTSPYRNPNLIPGPDGLFRHGDPEGLFRHGDPEGVYRHGNLTYMRGRDDGGYLTDEYEDYHQRPRQQKRKINRGQGRNNKLLWQFMVDLMVNPRLRHLADWVDREEGVFRIIQSAKVADMWGKEKGNADMNYEKMSRALRFLRTNDYFEMAPKPYNKRLHFKFGPKIHKLVQRKMGETKSRKANR